MERKNTIKKNKEGYGYTYTDITAINNYCMENGITYYQEVETCEINGKDYIITYLTENEETKRYRGCEIVQATLQGIKNPVQEYGSSLTYCRRYSLLMALGLATEDNDAQDLTISTINTKEDALKMTINFGKYNGKTLNDIQDDESYLEYLFTNSKDESTSDKIFAKIIENSYPEAYKCALKIKEYIENTYNYEVNEEIANLNIIDVDFLFAVRPVSANLELLHPNAIVEKLIDFLKPEYEKENVKLNVALCPEDTKLLLDEKLFREVIVNLSQNAIHAVNEKNNSEQDKIIEITSVIRDDKYVLSITDNGCGIPEDKLNKIFEPYYTTKATGTGLGLTTVYKIVKEFSGDISVKSIAGEGTSFIISIPVPQLNKKLLAYNESDNT